MPGLGIDFLPGFQQSLIDERGRDMVHEIALICTCRNEDTYAGLLGDGNQRRRLPFCPRCGGDGHLYRNPTVIKGLTTSIRQQKNILDAGIAQPGDMLFSPSLPSPDYTTPNGQIRIASMDKLTATWEQPLDEGQVVVRGAGTAYENKTLGAGLADNEDRLWYEPVSSIWCEDENGKIYTADADFVLGPGKIIKWLTNIPLRIKYSIKYNAFFEWISFTNPQERVDRQGDLGQLVFLRKRHVAFVNDSPLATEADRLALSSKLSC